MEKYKLTLDINRLNKADDLFAIVYKIWELI